MKTARAAIGVKEIKGPKHSSTIMGWVKNLGAGVLGIAVNDDETPWCGTFMAHVMKTHGHQPPKIAVRAKAWATWGDQCNPVEGAVLVFDRAGGGHVGLYVGEDKTHYHVLGGNQSDSVNIMRLEKSRMVAARWPKGVKVTGKKVNLSATAAKTSSNEA